VLLRKTPLGHDSQTVPFWHVAHEESQATQAPSLRYFPSTHPGVHLASFKRNPSEQAEQTLASLQDEHPLAHCVHTPLAG
jgi:hypothetical protein